MDIVETGRLRLREATRDDADFVLQLLNEPSWRTFIREHSISTVEQAADYLEERIISSYRSLGFGLWVVELRGGGFPTGICGLLKRDNLEDVDLGFAFLERFWGRGYAYEASRACLRYAARTLGTSRVLAITVAGNTRSIAVLERLGFKYESKFSHPGSDEVLDLYAVAGDRFASAPERDGTGAD